MILDAIPDATTGVFSVGPSTPEAEPMWVRPGPGIMAGLLAEPCLIHTVTRQQRRQAARKVEKARRTGAARMER